MIEVQTVEGDLLSRAEVFEEGELDTALARFDELHPQAPRLENAAACVNERFSQYFTLRDWVAIAKIFADDILYDDRRRVVNGGSWHGRDVVIENMRAITDFKIENLGFIAIRGERLCLSRWRWSNSDPVPETFHTEVLCLVEVDTDELISGLFVFDPEDVDAAFEELEARYLAGEAAVHFQAWSAITKSYAAVNRHEMPPTTPDWVNADHRRAIGFAPGDLKAYLRTTFDDLLPDIHVHVEIVHRLSDYGAVVTRFGRGTSSEGFLAEWREIGLSTVRGDRIERSEMFDETDLDDALARFDELRPETRRLENTASRSDDRFFAHTRARNWAAATEILAVDSVVDDRRRVVNIGAWEGRDVIIANIRALAESLADVTSTAIAIRGERLALTRICAPNRDLHQGDFGVEMLCVTELDADDRITAHIMFDVDDLDAAFEELDGRYLAGEASAHAHTWSVIANGYATLNRHEIPPTTPDFVNIDHRRGRAFEPGDMIPYMHATFGVASDIKGQVEVVHRLSDLGVVVTHAFCGTSEAGFNFEWREITLLTVDGDRVNRGEMFDEVDLDAALARFDELDRPVPVLENASTRTWVRLVDAYNRRDMSGFLALMTEGARLDDRRKGLRGIHDGLALWKNVQQLFQAASNWRSGMEVIATRGSQLSLTRHRVRDIDETDQPIMWEALSVMEVGDDNLMKETISFDPDDIDAALEELDARYLAGEAAAYQHTWAVIAQAYAALRRGDLPATTTDCVNIDHRRGIAFDGDVISYIRAAWDVAPDVKGYIEAVHRLTNLGALVAWASRGTSQAGFNAEWRGLNILTVNGDLINHGEIFEDTDLDAALARFDELDRPSLTQT